MSCFNCYSTRRSSPYAIEEVLERGHKLRNAMMKAIISDTQHNLDKNVKLDDLPVEANAKIRAFLQGDAMTRADEISTLETLRSMSAADLCKATDQTYRSQEPCESCNCLTCVEFSGLKQSDELTQKIQNRYKSSSSSLLKYVDSVKVSVSGVVLNEAGDKKVNGGLVRDKYALGGQTFFLEYTIPEVLTRNHDKSKAKVDSGLDSSDIVRLCARRASAGPLTVSFKQTSVHDIANLDRVKLQNAVLLFRLSFRNPKQKHATRLGTAQFGFSAFEVSKNMTCNQELAVRLSDNSPVVVGGLKVSIQLGCGRLYFGKEFIDAAVNNKESFVALGSDDLSTSSSGVDCTISKRTLPETVPLVPKLKLSQRKVEPVRNGDAKPVAQNRCSKPLTQNRGSKPVVQTGCPKHIDKLLAQDQYQGPVVQAQSPKPILFGFVYVAGAQYAREVLNSYLACQLFAQDDVSFSKCVPLTCNPVYNFTQQIPLVYDEDFLSGLRENFMVAEFFEKSHPKDFILGICKLNLHQFYLTYRNPIILKYLSERHLPVIGCDGWESIVNPNDGEIVGRAQFLVALGTKEQIENLERERGFNNSPVKANPSPKPPVSKRIDAAVQSEMDGKPDIETLLKQIVAQKNGPVRMENGTNTEPPPLEEETPVRDNVQKTSDLLESLQKALVVEPVKDKSCFKAQVAINSALHLPSRKKCKSKRNKARNARHEDILPSTYVTFECFKGDLKMTKIVPKNTSPKWDFTSEAFLPVECLTDDRKFLVFKVWRKSTNTTTLPNMQTDHVIGFATVDLTVLSAGLPSVQGWFDINDLSRRCNGQINIHVTPLENVTNHQQTKNCGTTSTSSSSASGHSPDSLLGEPNELLGRALKRKFSELDEITQRLRLRLSKVTNDESDTSNDEVADEFERDINTLCVEDDFDLVDFEQEASNFSRNRIEEVGLLQQDRHSVEDKQKIDQLLEKLSLISGENTSRYVSGCSEARFDAETILQDLDTGSRPNLFSGAAFDREMVQKFGNFMSESGDRAGPEGNHSESSD